MSAQLQEALKRAWITLAAIVAAGLLPLLPDLLSKAPVSRDDMIRAFVAGAAGAFVKRFLGEGLFDSKRNDAGDVIPGDVTPNP